MLLLIPRLLLQLLFWLIIAAMFAGASVQHIGQGYVTTCWNYDGRRDCYVTSTPDPVRLLLEHYAPAPGKPLIAFRSA